MGALDGLKVADFSWVGAGPRSTKDLADNGAIVVKVESRKRLDLGRMSPPFAGGDSKNPDASAFFAQTNTSKKSVTINLSDPEGVAVAKRLVAWADVVVENFGPGYMDRIGLGYEELCRIRPGVILLSVSVAGRTGPMAGYRGYGNIAAAQSGHAALTGWADGDPHMPPLAYGDVIAPMFATVAVLAALEHRAKTGQGQHLDVSQIEPMVHVIADLFASGAEKSENDDPRFATHGIFPLAGDDRWIAIASEQPLDLDTTQHGAELVDTLAAQGIAAGLSQDGRDISGSPDLREHFCRPEHPVLGGAAMPAPPMRLPKTPWQVGPAPTLGQHNAEILAEIGLTEAEIAALKEKGALA